MSSGKSEGLTSDRLMALRRVPVSRETEERFDIFVDSLARWRNKTNLISETTFSTVWTRHIADSAQTFLNSPRVTRWLDIGTGAGFPGIVIAMQLADIDGAVVHCVESDQRKCAFLRAVACATRVPAVVHPVSIQSIDPSVFGNVDGITARAFAPLSMTLDVAKTWLTAGAVGVFPRGKSVVKQLETLGSFSNYEIDIVPSVIDASAAILRIRIR